MDLTWGCQIVGWEKKLSNSLSLFIRKGFFSLNILLYYINKILFVFKKSVIYFLYFWTVRMKASMDQICILNIKDIYFQKSVSETVKFCKPHCFSCIICSLSRKNWIHCVSQEIPHEQSNQDTYHLSKDSASTLKNAKIKPSPFLRCIVVSICRLRGILATKLSLNTFLKAWNNSKKRMKCSCFLWHFYLSPVVIGLCNRGPKNCSNVYLVP